MTAQIFDQQNRYETPIDGDASAERYARMRLNHVDVPGQLWERVAESKRSTRCASQGAIVLPRLADERGPRIVSHTYSTSGVYLRDDASGVIRAGVRVK